MTGRDEADPGPFLRPYAMTEGRTEPSGPDLAIEDLIGATSAADPPPWLSLEHRTIAMACRETLSVAELAARVDLPLGVTRVLVGDLASQSHCLHAGDRPFERLTLHQLHHQVVGPDVVNLADMRVIH